MDIQTVIKRLRKAYGKPPRRPLREPVAELVLTILSQHTSDLNSDRTFASLESRFPDWEAVARADTADIGDAIKQGGLHKVKATVIKNALQSILRERGNLDLSFLSEIGLAEARSWLTRLPGVGPKTAACVLLFSLGKPALPVDTHVHRVARRLGLVDDKASPEQTEQELEKIVPSRQVYDLHINMVIHGRRTCHSRNPSCPICVFKDICPSAPAFLCLYDARNRKA